MYLIRLALRPWRVAPASQLSSALAVGLLLVISGLLLWLEQGLAPAVERMRRDQVITAYIDPSLDAGEEKRIADEIRVNLGAKSVEVRAVPAETFLSELREHYPDLGRELEGLGSDMNALIPRYVSASGMLGEGALAKIKDIQGVEAVESTSDRYKHVIGAFSALRRVSRWLAAGLAVALMTGLAHLARMNGDLHRETMALMQLFGAGSFESRIPQVLSGVSVGALGGAIAGGAWLTGAPGLGAQLAALSPMLKAMATPDPRYAAFLLLAGLAAGLACGLFGVGKRA